MASTFYLGEREGGRILAYGDATTQVGDDFQAGFETWDLIPAGEVGDCLFRSIDLSFNAVAGYAIGITPIVDDVAQTEQTFSGATSGEVQCQAFFAKRGTRCRTIVRTLSRTGDIVWHNCAASFVVIRGTP